MVWAKGQRVFVCPALRTGRLRPLLPSPMADRSRWHWLIMSMKFLFHSPRGLALYRIIDKRWFQRRVKNFHVESEDLS